MENIYDYNYLECMKERIKAFLNDEVFTSTEKDIFTITAEELSDRLRTDDSITWNGSGSRTFNRREAQQRVLHNEDLLEETIDEFWIDMGKMRNNREYLDVSIRCYLLPQACEEALEEIRKEAFQ